MSIRILKDFPMDSLMRKPPKDMPIKEIVKSVLSQAYRANSWEFVVKSISSSLLNFGILSTKMVEGQVVSLAFGVTGAYVDIFSNQMKNVPRFHGENMEVVTIFGFDLESKKIDPPLVSDCNSRAGLAEALSLDSSPEVLLERVKEGVTSFSTAHLSEVNDSTVVYASLVRVGGRDVDTDAFAYTIFSYKKEDPENTIQCIAGNFGYRDVSNLLDYLDGVFSVAKVAAEMSLPFEVPQGVSFTEYVDSLMTNDALFNDMLSHVEERSNELVN